MEYQRKNQSSGKWKAIVITFSVIGAILLGGGLIYLSRKKDSKFGGGTNLGAQQNQQTQNAVLQLASNLLDNNNNLNQLTKKPDGRLKTIQEIEEEFLISAFSKQPDVGISQTLPPEIIERIWWELRPWIEEYLQDLNQSILEHAREKFRRDVENWLRWQQREYNRQLEEYQKRLQELKKIEDLIREYQRIREQELLDKISRKTELRNKGYIDRDIEKLKEWDLLDQEIPDLTAEKRIGATNILWTSKREHGKIGGSSDLVIFLKPKSAKIPRVESNINQNNSEMVINFSTKVAYDDEKGYKQFIRDFLTEKGKFDFDTYCLIRTDASMSGPSAGIAYYLALYSLTNQIPLPRNLGSTGTVFERPKVGGIGGLNLKLEYNIKAEKPVNIFILSEENKRDERYHEQSFEHIPEGTKGKIKQVHFISTIDQIEIALQEILNSPDEKMIHSCGKSEVRDKQEPKDIEFQATPEQFLALIADNMIGRQEFKKIDEKTSEAGRTIPNPELREIYQVVFKNSQFSEAISKAKSLYNEYKQKIDSNSADEWYKNQLAQLENQSQNQENSKTDPEKIREIQVMIGRLKQEAIQKKQDYGQFKAASEQRITEIQKQIEGLNQAKTNEEVILQKIDLDIEEAKRDPNRNTQDLERSKNEVNQRINQLTSQISTNEKQITDLKQEIEKLLQESSALEVQIERLELQLQELNQNQNPSSQEIQNKKHEIEQEYSRRQAETNQKFEQLCQEYEGKFKEIASPLANLIPNIQKQLVELGYQKIVINWKSTSFGRIHLTTLEPSVIFEIVKN
jgi:predicted  nucleic acid-binding Zn-ribbon protein